MKRLISTTILYAILVSIATAQQNWSQCSKPCGGGTRSREYCLWGSVCSTIYRGCNTEPCVIGGWGVWQPCSKSCGGGTTFKVDRCSWDDFNICAKTYNDCNTQQCDTIAGGCLRGYRFRYENPSSCCKVIHENCGVDSASSRRIVGGKNATQGDWPWVAALVKTGVDVIHCGASLLNKRWVVTAAHCLIPKVSMHVLLGSVTIKNPVSGSVIRGVEDRIPHPDYSCPKNDIGLVKMNASVSFTSYIKPICLPTGEITQIDTTCVVAGWGRTIWNNAKSYTNHLQQVKIRTLPLDACIQGYKNEWDDIWSKVDKKQHICAGILSGDKDSCNGDSGGPLMCQRCSTCGWYLAGTVSFGAKVCGKEGVPAGYMNVYNYQYWIRQYVSLSNKKYFVC